jgi:hypothetical protein
MQNLAIQANTETGSLVKHPESYFDQFAHYENPLVARDIFKTYQSEYVIPEKKLLTALNTCTTINQLRARLGELELRFTQPVVFVETSADYHRPTEASTRQELLEGALDLLDRHC